LFNDLIWDRCPKTKSVGKQTVTIAVTDFISVLSDGRMTEHRIFEQKEVTAGK
jgi:hypothetical protein